MHMAKTELLERELDTVATQLAGVVEVLELIGMDSEHANALGIVRDMVGQGSARISAVSEKLRYPRRPR
jgi:hypothetical protein